MKAFAIIISCACLLGVSSAFGGGETSKEHRLDLNVTQWRLIERESGPVNYYEVLNEPPTPFMRARYQPPWKTAVMGVPLAEQDRQRARGVEWSWRAITLPRGGNECAKGQGDSAAVVYLAWKRMLRWYSLKYVWSAVGPKGATCDQKRNPFVAQDTVILQSGSPLNTWRTERIDLKAEFRKHFEKGDPNADVPDFMGIGIMTDGDQTKSESTADYANFVLIRQ